jgi:hypothetical protein
MSERRRAKRIAARFKVWCEGEQFTLLAETGNVSRSGLFVRTSSPPPPNEQFKVTIDELGMVALVEVSWSRAGRGARDGMGLRIVSFERGSSEYLHFIDQSRSPSGEHRLGPWPAKTGGFPEPEEGDEP